MSPSGTKELPMLIKVLTKQNRLFLARFEPYARPAFYNYDNTKFFINTRAIMKFSICLQTKTTNDRKNWRRFKKNRRPVFGCY